MRKWHVLAAIIGLLGTTSTALAGVDAPNSLMRKAYGSYNSQLKCWITQGGQLNRPHCMKPVSLDEVTVEGQKLSYLLVSGNEIDTKTGNIGGARASGGLVGMFVFSGSNSNPHIIAQEPLKEQGSYGVAPEGKFVKLGPRRYGWQLESSFTGQGYTDIWLQFYTLQKNGLSQYFIQDIGKIPIYHDDGGVRGDHVTIYDGKASIHEIDARDGYYPIYVQMNRQVKGKTLKPAAYEIRYSYGKGEYALPEDYPMEEQ